MSITFTTWMKKIKSNQSCTSLCSPKCISQHGWSLFFRLQCQQNTSSTAPPKPLESLWELHLFTKAFAWKLYKHNYTIKNGSYVTNVSQCFRPECKNFPSLELPSHPFTNAKTNYHMYNTHTYTPSACSHLHWLQMQGSLMSTSIFYLHNEYIISSMEDWS